jgi:hypothetical protein
LILILDLELASGALWGWGANSKGMLGLANEPEFVDRPKIIPTPPSAKFIQVACGMTHSVALTGLFVFICLFVFSIRFLTESKSKRQR